MSLAARENILNKIRQALAKPVAIPFPERNNYEFVYQPSTQELELEFAENFTKLQGRFSFCATKSELAEQLSALVSTRNWTKVICKEDLLQQQLAANNFTQLNNIVSLTDCDAAITTCESLVARTGSMLLVNSNESGRTYSIYAPVHICIAYTSQLVYDIADAISKMKTKYGDNLPSVVSLATGPSRTADIEKTLVVGVHGPKEVFCFLVDG
jgi:L-lactate dehydrogenase complex protein LldG